MFCPECGNKLSENQKFCDECGTKIPIKQRSNPVVQDISPAALPANQSTSFHIYLDKYIRETTAFSSANSLVDGAQPLRLKWIVISVICTLLGVILGIGIMFLTFLVSILLSRLVVNVLLIVRLRKVYTTWGRTADFDELVVFLEDHLCRFNFTAWKRGNPIGALGMKIDDVYVIECLFNNKTYHRICFDLNKPGKYRIETTRATVKERLKDGGDRNPNVLYKSDYIVRPILEAATKYYFRYMAK